MPMEIDSGASYSIISEHTYRQVLQRVTRLQEASVTLKTWSATPIALLGSIRVSVRWRNYSELLTLLIAKGDGPNLLGRNWFEPLGISLLYNLREKRPNDLQTTAKLDFAEVFKDGLGTYIGPVVSLSVLPGSVPKFMKSRFVPLAWRDKMEAEIANLVHDGVLEPVSHSDWAIGPVCGWLRPAVAFLKRKVNDTTAGWDDPTDDVELKTLLHEVVAGVTARDPAQGRWDVPGDEARVWVDASSLAIGVVLEVQGAVVEDASWLRANDAAHINMAELDAVVKGLNLAIAWQMRKIEVLTDSATVHQWLSDGLSGRARLRTKAAGEMLIRRRVSMVLSLVEEYHLLLTVTLIPSVSNKADALTRVPQRWLKPVTQVPEVMCAGAVEAEVSQSIADIHHTMGHPGVKRTLYFGRQVNPMVSRRQVRKVVADCESCCSVDPAPVKWRTGSLEVEEVWHRVGMDIVHAKGNLYLSLIDCGPSRFAIWRNIRSHSSADVVSQLDAVFFERGAPQELLADNDTAFKSQTFAQFAARWGVRMRFRCAYVPSGNGIVERCHRTVKVIAARKDCSIAEAVYLYNVTPRDDRNAWTAPANVLYRYSVRVRGADPRRLQNAEEKNAFAIGDAVWVKSPGSPCDVPFREGTVTRIISEQAVEVDGVPRHVRQLRRRVRPSEPSVPSSSGGDDNDDMPLYASVDVGVDAITASSSSSESTSEQNVELSPVASVDECRRPRRMRKSVRCYCCD